MPLKHTSPSLLTYPTTTYWTLPGEVYYLYSTLAPALPPPCPPPYLLYLPTLSLPPPEALLSARHTPIATTTKFIKGGGTIYI